MLRTLFLCLAAIACVSVMSAADSAAPPLSKTFDQQVGMVEREVVSLAEAMPADKYNFAPTQGEFTKVRTFGQQVSHIGAVVYLCSASVLAEKPPAEMGTGENGPDSLKTKADIVKYLKDSFAYAHKAMNSITVNNLNEMVDSAFEKKKVSRLSMATVPVWHTFDHYGQMVVYARMNGVVPPASR